MKLSFRDATVADAAAIASLRTAVAERLTRDFGHGHWSSAVTEKSVLRGIATSRTLVAHAGAAIVATLRLCTKKPWAIDVAYFKPATRPLYLHDMAVAPQKQRRGIGRRLVEEAVVIARGSPSQAIRLDAYDADAGAGGFYAKCGFVEVGRVVYRKTALIYFERIL